MVKGVLPRGQLRLDDPPGTKKPLRPEIDDPKIAPFVFFLRSRLRNLPFEELVILETPGYWKLRRHCHHYTRPRNGCWQYCGGDAAHSVHFAQYGLRDKKGRFRSCYEVWKYWWNNFNERYSELECGVCEENRREHNIEKLLSRR